MQPEAGQPLYQMSQSFDPGGGAGHGSPGLGQRQHDQFGFRPASAAPAPPTTPSYSGGADFHIPAAPQYPPLMTHPALQHQQQPPPAHMMGMHSMMMPQHPHQFQHMGGPHDLSHGLPPGIGGAPYPGAVHPHAMLHAHLMQQPLPYGLSGMMSSLALAQGYPHFAGHHMAAPPMPQHQGLPKPSTPLPGEPHAQDPGFCVPPFMALPPVTMPPPPPHLLQQQQPPDQHGGGSASGAMQMPAPLLPPPQQQQQHIPVYPHGPHQLLLPPPQLGPLHGASLHEHGGGGGSGDSSGTPCGMPGDMAAPPPAACSDLDGGGGGEHLDRQQQKRAANRKSAQLSRQRKKAYINELRQEHEELKRQEEILAVVPDPVFAFDALTGRISFASRSAAAQFGLRVEDLLAANLFDLVTADCSNRLRALIVRALADHAGAQTLLLGERMTVRFRKGGAASNVAMALGELSGRLNRQDGGQVACVCSVRVLSLMFDDHGDAQRAAAAFATAAAATDYNGDQSTSDMDQDGGSAASSGEETTSTGSTHGSGCTNGSGFTNGSAFTNGSGGGGGSPARQGGGGEGAAAGGLSAAAVGAHGGGDALGGGAGGDTCGDGYSDSVSLESGGNDGDDENLTDTDCSSSDNKSEQSSDGGGSDGDGAARKEQAHAQPRPPPQQQHGGRGDAAGGGSGGGNTSSSSSSSSKGKTTASGHSSSGSSSRANEKRRQDSSGGGGACAAPEQQQRDVMLFDGAAQTAQPALPLALVAEQDGTVPVRNAKRQRVHYEDDIAALPDAGAPGQSHLSHQNWQQQQQQQWQQHPLHWQPLQQHLQHWPLQPPLAQQHQQQQHQQWAGHTLWDRHVECAGSGSAMQEVHEATAPASASASAGAASTIAGQVHSGAALVQAAASSASNREGRTRIVSL